MMMKSTFLVIGICTITGTMLGVGYASLIEKFPGNGPVFVMMFFSHLVIMAYLLARGVLYDDLMEICQEQNDVLQNFIDKR